ncbi:MAG: hypothetical protein MGF17_05645, partial [Trichodesmium sp. MAG_R04]|nr:hypothetical protein [Trichodesmium sp. MAG_R04]
SHLGDSMLSLFIPTTPNPTSGWYAIVPEKDVINVSLSVEDAFKVLISGGIVSPSSSTVISQEEILNNQLKLARPN